MTEVGTLLARVVRATATAGDRDVLLERVAQLLLGPADWVLADRLDEPDLITRVAAVSADGRIALPPDMGAVSARRSAAGSVGLLPALAAAPGQLLRLGPDDLEALAASPEPHLAAQARTALGLGTRDLLLLGLVSRGRHGGVLSLGSRTGFPDDVVAELADVALHVGVALEGVRLLRVQRAVATALQTSLLPPVPSVPGLRLAARYSPAASDLDVGGDWYDAFPTPRGLVVTVGDVRGHDLAAATQMADLRNLLRAHAVDRDEGPAAWLSRLERTAEALGLEVAATCVTGLLDSDGVLTWSSAGHLPPVLLRDGRAVLLETEADLMLGVSTGTVRTDQTTQLLPGDTVLLYTDGLVEVRGASLAGRLEVLRATVEQHATAPPDALAELVLPLADGAADDVALLVLHLLPV
ncbi:MAG: hypothetical protein JWN17_2687 [Frankiales bacterium]|nr:hypothetical protein [Frankiales bacterium]